MSEVPARSPLRLRDYDYSKNGAYFVTVCTKDRAHLFGRIVGAGHPAGPYTELSEYGVIVEEHIRAISQVYPSIFVDTYVIMPDHIHLIIRIDRVDGPAGCPAPTASLPKIVSALKSLCTRSAKRPLWQRGYYEHIIRNHEDYISCAEYIQNNPGKWLETH